MEITLTSRSEYEAICQDQKIDCYPDAIFDRWSFEAAGGPVEHNLIHAGRQQTYAYEKAGMPIPSFYKATPAARAATSAIPSPTPIATAPVQIVDLPEAAPRVENDGFKPDATTRTGACSHCGNPGVWISGAAEILCMRHQDDY